MDHDILSFYDAPVAGKTEKLPYKMAPDSLSKFILGWLQDDEVVAEPDPASDGGDDVGFLLSTDYCELEDRSRKDLNSELCHNMIFFVQKVFTFVSK